MALLDIVMLVIVVGGGFIGWRKRFTGQLGSIAGIILGIFLCRICAGNIADYYTQPTDTVQTRLLHVVLAYALIGVGSYMAVRVAMGLMRSMLRALHLGIVDNAAGAVFSVFQWLLGLSLVLNVWLAIFPDSDLRTQNQGAVDYVIDLAPAVFGSETARNILNSEFSSSADESQSTNSVSEDSAQTDL
jgi:uncharacterized membrane protein required for colicin V production